jgi:hypothetical protein
MEVNYNWTKANLSANFALWFKEEREVRSVTAHNTTEPNDMFLKYQPGRTGIIVRQECIQYAKNLQRMPQVWVDGVPGLFMPTRTT